MPTKLNTLGSPQEKSDVTEEKLGCWRVWLRPKTSRKDAKKRGHMIFGPYPFNAKK